MKALVLEKPGKPDSLHTAEVPQPEPGKGEVRVKVLAVGLNPVDYKLAATGFPGWQYPFILGLDVAGVIDATGPDITEWEVGDPVYYHGNLSRPGGYGQYTVTDARSLSWLPEGLNYSQAAALPCAGFTAYQIINRKLRPQTGRTLLVHGGAGGVGGFCVQLARLAGAKVIATCSRHNFNFVKELGADDVIDYKEENVVQKVQKLTGGRGADYIIDTVGPENATASLEMLAFGGELACVAGLPDLTKIEPGSKAFSLHEIALGSAYLSGDAQAIDDLARIGREFGALVSKGTIKPMVEEVVTMEDIPDALQRLSMRHQRGKIVAQIANN